MLAPILSGFFVKTITGLDDSITRIPILATYTKTLKGKIIFSVGTLMAIVLAIILAMFFSNLISSFTFSKELSAILVFLLALSIYFNLFVHKPRDKAESKIKKLPKINFQRATKLFGIGNFDSKCKGMTKIDNVNNVLPQCNFYNGQLKPANLSSSELTNNKCNDKSC